MISLVRNKTTNRLLATALAAGAACILALCLPAYAGGAHYTPIPAPDLKLHPATGETGEAVLAGGCFWGMEMVFQHVEGVHKVISGYAGGSAATASYAETSTGETGHAESVHIFYDPQQISFGKLLRIYFSVAHDPTQVNRQGADVGPQYRSEIFALNQAQQKMAHAYIRQLNDAGVFSQPIATQVSLIRTDEFYPAERYHQNFGLKHPNSAYIQIVDVPKVRSLAQHFSKLYRDTAQVAARHG